MSLWLHTICVGNAIQVVPDRPLEISNIAIHNVSELYVFSPTRVMLWREDTPYTLAIFMAGMPPMFATKVRLDRGVSYRVEVTGENNSTSVSIVGHFETRVVVSQAQAQAQTQNKRRLDGEEAERSGPSANKRARLEGGIQGPLSRAEGLEPSPRNGESSTRAMAVGPRAMAVGPRPMTPTVAHAHAHGWNDLAGLAHGRNDAANASTGHGHGIRRDID
ncbi:hypothetical protein V5O48_012846 [Marasmius crinis-equi]|uniref:Uncharacterized protein n=1 Tax=Marasmius crinis-equi TaxID=585013 RepID=A0ABR3F290_9AGAR